MSKEELSEHINLNCCGQGMQRSKVAQDAMMLEYERDMLTDAVNSLEKHLDTQKSRNLLLEEEILTFKRQIEQYEDYLK